MLDRKLRPGDLLTGRAAGLEVQRRKRCQGREEGRAGRGGPRAGGGTHGRHWAKADGPSWFDRQALFVKPDCQERSHDHESGKRGEQDVVAPERDEGPHKDDRQQEHAHAVGKAIGFI